LNHVPTDLKIPVRVTLSETWYETRARAILIEGLTAASHIELSELEIANIEDTDRVEMTATITSHKRRELALETVIGRLSKESGVLRAGWREHTQSV
jgi:putative Mg2+ transporter-C (MgtC) family protein